jgi:hypothetical protein
MRRIVVFMALVMMLTVAMAKGTASKPLLFTAERIEAAKQRMQNDSEMHKGWESIKAEADRQLQNGSLMKADYMALVWLMTGDRRYADALKDILYRSTESGLWGNAEMLSRKPAWRSELQMAMKCQQSAVAYSTIRHLLSDSERRELSSRLLQIGVEPLLGDWLLEPTRIHSLNSMGHNWWTACVYEGALLAMAIEDDQPQCRQWVEESLEAMPMWFGFAGDELQNKPRSFDRQGGMYESVNYASFGISEALRFLVAWHDRHPKAAMPDIPQLDGITRFFVSACYPRQGELYSVNFGDSHLPMAGELPLAFLWALGRHDSDILWYTAQVQPHQHHEGAFLDEPTGFIFRPDTRKASAAPKETKELLLSDFGWAMMRTSWQKDATMLAVKSGHTWNHNHADANSFQLFHRGSQILKDCGNCTYGKEAYRQYFFQSEAHNVIKLNGEGQSPYQQYHGSMLDGHLSHMMVNGAMRYVMGDATGPMSDKVSRWFRHWLWLDNIIYLVDDIHAHQPSEIEWLWHYNGTAKRSHGRLDIADGQAAVSVIPLYPQTMALSDYLHDYPDQMYWDVRRAPKEDLKTEEEYYALRLPGKSEYVKGVTAIVLKDGPDDLDLPEIERREGKDWIGLRVKHHGQITDLYINQLADGRLMHSNSWITCDGWTTDAYMLAVSYPEGKSSAETHSMFVGYGSSVRRDSEAWLSSLSKLFVMADFQKGTSGVVIDGQHYNKTAYPSRITIMSASCRK